MKTRISGKDEDVGIAPIYESKALYIRKQEGGKRKWVKIGTIESSQYRDLMYIDWEFSKKELYKLLEYTPK